MRKYVHTFEKVRNVKSYSLRVETDLTQFFISFVPKVQFENMPTLENVDQQRGTSGVPCERAKSV